MNSALRRVYWLLALFLPIACGLTICLAVVYYKTEMFRCYPDFGPIHQAAQSGNVPELKRLLVHNPSLLEAPGGMRDPRGDLVFWGTPLQYAAISGSLKTVSYLVEHNAIVDNVAPLSSDAPLMLSIDGRDQTDVPRFLIAHGADVNRRNADGSTPLHRAVTCTAINVMQLLLRHGADINAKRRDGATPLFLAASGINSSKAVKLLLDFGASVSARADGGITPLHRAVLTGDVATVAFLLQAGAPCNAKDDSGRTPLHYLAMLFSDESSRIFAMLKAHGADSTIKDATGKTAMDLAVLRSNARMAEILKGR
jgi:ankyrin repeat protein